MWPVSVAVPVLGSSTNDPVDGTSEPGPDVKINLKPSFAQVPPDVSDMFGSKPGRKTAKPEKGVLVLSGHSRKCALQSSACAATASQCTSGN